MAGVIFKAYCAACFIAMVLVVISPKISHLDVIIPVILAMFAAKLLNPISLNVSIKNAVAMADAPMLVILFPIKMAVIKFFGFSKTFSNRFAPLTFCSFKLLNLILLTAVNAVSALEKNAESMMNSTKIKNFITRIDSKVSPFMCLLVLLVWE